MKNNSLVTHGGVFILIAAGFEETAVVSLLAQFRDAGIPLTVISLQAGMTRGSRGLEIQPDSYLGKLPQWTPQLLLFPGGRACVNKLLTDPRVYRLVERTVAEGGRIAGMSGAEAVLAMMPQFTTGEQYQLLTQGRLGAEEFGEVLVGLMRGCENIFQLLAPKATS